MSNLYTKDGKEYTAIQVAKANEKDLIELGPVRVYEDAQGNDIAEIQTPSGSINVSAPGYVLKDPTGSLFGISLQDLLAQYVPHP